MYRYILLDSSQSMRFHKQLEQRAVFYRSLFDGHAEESLLGMAPLLIDVTVENDATRQVLEDVSRLAQRKPCVSTMYASLPLDQLAEHLRQFHLIEMPEGRALLLRWYDTRILPTWLSILQPAQLAFFTHGITNWASIDRFGIEQQHDLPIQAKVVLPSAAHSLQLNQVQADALFAASESDALIHELRRTSRAEIDRVPHSKLYQFVCEHWEIARQHGLTEQVDQVDFLMLALHTSGRFVDHPIVIDRLASPAHGNTQSFNAWFKALPDAVWEMGNPLWEEAHA